MLEFLTDEQVLIIHQDQIDRYGGIPGLRDSNLLLSALYQPLSSFNGSFLHKSLFEMGAAYLFHIVKNHPFNDGNKRTAIVSALMFLSINEVEIDSTNDELEKMVLEVIAGDLNKEAIAQWFESHLAI